MLNKYKSIAFTLAEMLITLGIIGIIAAMLIPAILNEKQEIGLKSQLKKNVSVATQAFKAAAMDNGGSLAGYSAIVGDTMKRADDLSNIVQPHLRYLKKCTYSNPSPCVPVSSYKMSDGQAWNVPGWPFGSNPKTYSQAVIVLNDGSVWWFFANYDSMKDCQTNWLLPQNSCGLLTMDINGANGPNKAGYDFFQFHIEASGFLVPMGSSRDLFRNTYSKTLGYTARLQEMFYN